MDTTESERTFTKKDLKEAFFNGGMELKVDIDMSGTAAGIEAFNEWFRQYDERVLSERKPDKDSASGVRVNARVSDNRRGGSISINWGEYGGFYWLNKSFTKRLCIGWLAITYWPIDLDEMIERLLH